MLVLVDDYRLIWFILNGWRCYHLWATSHLLLFLRRLMILIRDHRQMLAANQHLVILHTYWAAYCTTPIDPYRSQAWELLFTFAHLRKRHLFHHKSGREKRNSYFYFDLELSFIDLAPLRTMFVVNNTRFGNAVDELSISHALKGITQADLIGWSATD